MIASKQGKRNKRWKYQNHWNPESISIEKIKNLSKFVKGIQYYIFEKLQRILLNQTIEPMFYEMHSLIKKKDIFLIDHSTIFDSIKCFMLIKKDQQVIWAKSFIIYNIM